MTNLSVLLPRVLALGIFLALVAGVLALSQDTANRAIGLALAFGAVFGVTLQRSRFCFFCHTRDFLEKSDARGVIAILLALAIGCAGYLIVVSAWLPVPAPERLPPTAHIGPVAWPLGLAAFLFGLGMAISGSCISAHLYRLGEGSPVAPFALLGTLGGFVLGFLTWNPLYLAAIAEAPVVWLPHRFGHAGTFGVSLSALLLLAILAVRRAQTKSPGRPPGVLDLRSLARSIFVERWPAALGGAIIGVLSAASYLRIGPLGVTAELGSLARTSADQIHLLPETLHGLDGFRGCATVVKATLLSQNGAFISGLVAASFMSALVAGQFAPRWPSRSEILSGLGGGLLLGWGAMTALGCTVGVLLSGIHAGALSGWVFLAACFPGIWLGLRIRRLWA